MNFNIEDPLAGILSDGSDDSFFDDDILGKKKPPKKKETPTAERKNALFDIGEPITQTNNTKAEDKDLFGDENLKRESSYNEVKSAQKASPTPFKRTISKDSIKINQNEAKTKLLTEKIEVAKSPAKSKPIMNVDKLNILDDAKKDPMKPLERGKSSQSLFDDILGGPSLKSGTSTQFTKPTTAAKKEDFDLDSILGNTEPKTTSSKIESQKPVKIEPPKDIKPKKGKPSDDWLGIFQEKDEVMEEDDTDDVPAWLGGGDKKKKAVNEPSMKTKPTKQSHPEEKPKSVVETDETNKTTIDSNIDKVMKADFTPNAPKLDINQEDLTMEGASLYLQQQESQLMIALQLKAQDEKLASMQLRQKESQRVQREAALAQHEQIDAMLRRQAQHRQQMQNIIAAHQERITQRIKALLGDVNTEHDEELEMTNEYETTENRKESPQAKERKQLLQLVQSLQENHDKEVDLMETSYRRQLAFLEVSFTQTEERMKEESEKLVKFYAEKISWLDEHHQLYKRMYEDNLSSLTERHKNEHDLIRQQHLENIKVLQEHHAALMENIKNAVKQEQVLIKDSASFSSDLQELLSNVKIGNEKCGQLYEKVELLSQNTHRDTERSLQIRETQITDMIEQLRKERESFEKEKSESKSMVNMLEARLKQMTSMIEEESALLRQKKMEFEFEKATFSKQTEFAKNVLKKQDEEIKMLKEDIQKEYQDKVAKIDEERAKALKDSALVAKEKASIQSLKLELEKTKAELQAQLEELTEERTKINTEKQELHLEEQRVMSKSRDLDLLAKTAMEKQSQADKKYSEAEFLQRKYEDRIRRVQEHVVSLNAREKQIAKEKVALSRERLSLHNERKEIDNRQQCSLCRSSQYNTEYAYMAYNAPASRVYGDVSREYGNLSAPVNVVEAEMAQLMGRVGHEVNVDGIDGDQEPGPLKDYMDPKLMMLRLDVQQVISHLDQTKKDEIKNSHQE
ncbi:cytadherence high molecular weight protein 2-like [Maniola jurtina]|uniref:cytadherence high molecular weight protein 2-like n=1 Tax=Maniola jurtina TaxID=191418 RepID=UPI001E689671|nr:cytadherence high molecular weight protein 2-like [Maniola jurtina]